ncbi:class I SAM-dependent methyltransferase [Paenibacillus doosanensis]|uniref:class I SAM-dependent methyltransferase n=1 Tax=Paenibacillus doosanensis TaxID=1229154 RepID=UPI00217F5B4D|nr:class I SAM-dependent methyltransferase [Paenibacillus doosanensis]MCS7462795.1 class I SAM-dependent methyltransferase [Paenibacillus doosanensis]
MAQSEGQQWNALLYDSKIGFVSRLGKGVVDLLAPRQGERILDLGCGTGDLAREIAQFGASCKGIDSSADMVEQARVKYPELAFETADAHTFRLGESFDAVFSNAALHWMKRPEEVIESVRAALKDGGRFVAEFGGSGNVGRIYKAIVQVLKSHGIDAEARNPWYFPTVGEYSGLLEKHGFEVRYMELFDRPTELVDGDQGMRYWLDTFGGMFFAGMTEDEKREAYDECCSLLRPELFNGAFWTADYRRLRFAAVRR